MANVVVTIFETGEVVGRFAHINDFHRWNMRHGRTDVSYVIARAA